MSGSHVALQQKTVTPLRRAGIGEMAANA